MAGIGDLIASISVDNTGFKKCLSGASSSLKSFSGGISGMLAPIAGMLAGIWGGSAAVGGAKIDGYDKGTTDENPVYLHGPNWDAREQAKAKLTQEDKE